MLNRIPALVIVFVSSAAILVLEILASRMMAPHVGMSHEIFTSIIGVILAGIAGGSVLGGYIADRNNTKPIIGFMFIAGGLATVCTIPIVPLVGRQVSADVPGIVILTLASFFIPSVFLSSVGPMVAKLRLSSLENTGEVVGALSAWGTLGALVATFTTGFILISYMAVNTIIIAVSAMLVCIGIYYVMVGGRRVNVTTLLCIAVLFSIPYGFKNPCEYHSSYTCIRVDEVDGVKQLIMDRSVHSAMKLDEPLYQHFRYSKVISEVIDAIQKDTVNAIHVGGGAFGIPRYISASKPGSTNTTLEIDPVLIDIAREEFGYVSREQNKVIIGDARVSLGKIDSASADVVLGDAFSLNNAVPWHLTTLEFNSDIKRVLKPDGIYIMNLIDVKGGEFSRSIFRTLSEEFSHLQVTVLGKGNSTRFNQIVLATNSPFSVQLSNPHWVFGNTPQSDSILLTDSYAPVERLIRSALADKL